AIDGPCGAGKSTIARTLAKKLGYIYVDTGALYRAVGFYALSKGAKPSNAEDVVPLLSEIDVNIAFVNGEQRVFLNGEDVSEKIRTPEISMAASDVSAVPEVRKFLFGLQLKIARENNVIMDGRDIGTVVLPNADVKIFLTASPEDRAKRRYEELKCKGSDVTYEEIYSDLLKRDYNDSHRETAPLKKAEDAILVDTTGFPFEKSVETLLGVILSRLEEK
ncbi:MAG: (d)CMP kinase, partial [Oscillospiraceae bacterium]|nr:(d)CMP kinase [Oscillospiraceae bacterium]